MPTSSICIRKRSRSSCSCPAFTTLRSCGASILRRDLPQGVEFLVVTVWKSLDAIRSFAGSDVESAVVPDKVQKMMIEYDRRARHYEVVD
jgi:hypothetical protein